MQSALVVLRFVPEKAALFQAVDDYHTRIGGVKVNPAKLIERAVVKIITFWLGVSRK